MLKIYTSFGYDVNTLNEYEGEYETLMKALAALEEQRLIDNIGYVYNIARKQTEYLCAIAYGEIECVEVLKYVTKDSMIEELKKVLEEIERRNA